MRWWRRSGRGFRSTATTRTKFHLWRTLRGAAAGVSSGASALVDQAAWTTLACENMHACRCALSRVSSCPEALTEFENALGACRRLASVPPLPPHPCCCCCSALLTRKSQHGLAESRLGCSSCSGDWLATGHRNGSETAGCHSVAKVLPGASECLARFWLCRTEAGTAAPMAATFSNCGTAPVAQQQGYDRAC